MTNAESVDKYRIVARHILAMCHRANCGVNRMEFITLTTVPYLLPFVEAELDLRKKFICWKLHICKGNERADMAAVSALSLPTMLTWLGIQQKIIVYHC